MGSGLFPGPFLHVHSSSFQGHSITPGRTLLSGTLSEQGGDREQGQWRPRSQSIPGSDLLPWLPLTSPSCLLLTWDGLPPTDPTRAIHWEPSAGSSRACSPGKLSASSPPFPTQKCNRQVAQFSKTYYEQSFFWKLSRSSRLGRPGQNPRVYFMFQGFSVKSYSVGYQNLVTLTPQSLVAVSCFSQCSASLFIINLFCRGYQSAVMSWGGFIGATCGLF